jgi:hypothetical protein
MINLRTVAAFVLAAATLGAAPVTVLNPSFETDGGTGYPANWNGTCGSCGYFTITATEFPGGFAAGSHTLYVNQTVGLHQVLSTPLTANTAYTLTVAVGDRFDTDFAGSRIQLRAGATFGSSVLVQELVDGVTPANGSFSLANLTYTSPASGGPIGQNLIIWLGGSTLGVTQTHFDAVSLDATPTPEPATGFAMLGGIALLAAFRRRIANGVGARLPRL